jgi:hypothetical protein
VAAPAEALAKAGESAIGNRESSIAAPAEALAKTGESSIVNRQS